MDETDQKWWLTIGSYLWRNRDQILARLAKLRGWLFPPKDAPDGRGVLIIGPGGVGKSTTGRFLLAGGFELPDDAPQGYTESLDLETYALADDPDVEVVVPPGQRHRRDATWGDLERKISAGGFRGIILTCSYGYHSLGQFSYKDHRLYRGDLGAFVTSFLDDCRKDELAVLERLRPHICAVGRKFWILTLVTKQDLWWHDRSNVETFYQEGRYGRAMAEIAGRIGSSNFRHESVFASLVISNFTTGNGELLAETTAGYDQNLQADSLRRFVRTLEGLRQWEESK
jgi:hypothetical protein